MKKGSEEHLRYKEARGLAIETKKVQSREPWDLRVVKLQLLHPRAFADCLILRQTNPSDRSRTEQYFYIYLRGMGVLTSIDMGEVTPYRMTLLLRACRSYQRQCDKERRGRAQKQAAEDQ